MCVKIFLFLILKYLQYQFSYIRKLFCWDRCKVHLLHNPPVFQGSRLAKAPFFLLLTLPKKKIIKDSKSAGLVRFTEEILNGKLHFLCSVKCWCLGEPKINMYRSNIKGLTKNMWTKVRFHCRFLNTRAAD